MYQTVIAPLLVMVTLLGQVAAAPPPPAAPPVPACLDHYEKWPILSIIRTVGYEDIQTVTVMPSPLQVQSANGPLPLKQQQNREKRAMQLWLRAKPQVTKVVRQVRHDVVPLLDAMQVDPSVLRGDPIEAFAMTHGQATRSPYLVMHFAIEKHQPRLDRLYLYVTPPPGEWPLRQEEQWRRYALTSLFDVFAIPPYGRLKTVTLHNGYYFNWTPHWNKLPLPKVFIMQFALLHHGKERVYAWSLSKTTRQVTAAKRYLDTYPFTCELQRASMIVVKNALALSGQPIAVDSRLWAKCRVILPGSPGFPNPFEQPTARVIHLNRPEVDRLMATGEPLLAWRVRIVPSGKPRTSIVGWVDAATASLLYMGVNAPPQ